MSFAEQRFLEELENELRNNPNKEEILADYKMHMNDLMQEESLADENEQYQAFREQLGAPIEIAKMWKQEVSITPGKMQGLFVTFNVGLFVGGGLLTFGYHVFDWAWLNILWKTLTSIPAIIILVYFVFWGLLGYEIGKEFGSRGKKLLRRTFAICIIPNLTLMYLVVFRLIPYEWFQPLLNVPFIISCILLSLLLYPVSWLGYRWGKRESV